MMTNPTTLPVHNAYSATRLSDWLTANQYAFTTSTVDGMVTYALDQASLTAYRNSLRNKGTS